MSMSLVSTPQKSSRQLKTAIFIGGGVLAVGVIVFFAWYLFGGWQVEPFNGPTWTVERQKLHFRIVERGTLESAENSDIYCRVQARSKGNSNATTIKWLIPDGAEVVKGQKLIELDSSAFVEDMNDQKIKVDEAHAKSVKADNDLDIQLIQNKGDIATAETNVLLAELELFTFLGEEIGSQVLGLSSEKVAKYLKRDLVKALENATPEGEYFTERDKLLGEITKKKSDLQMIKDRASWSKRMEKIGVVSRSQMESDQATQQGTEIDLRKLKGDLKIHEKFKLVKTVTDLYSKVQEAKRELERTKTQADSKQKQAEIENKTKLSIFIQEKSRLEEIEKEIDKCILFSPQDGLVVYYVPQQSRSRSGSQQSIVAQGEPVREGQKLMQIPDLTKMQVNVRVHEAMVSRMHGDEFEATGFSKFLINFLSDVKSISTPDLSRPSHATIRSQIRKKMKKLDYVKVKDGQVARVRVDAYPHKTLEAHVKSVATIASQADWLSSDVRVYTTLVSIDEKVKDLKPGMSAEVTIYAEESSGDVLAVPIQSVVGTLAMGAKRKCFVIGPDGTAKERDIVVGMTTNKMVEVKSGLKEGEQVALNPTPLLSEDSNMKVGVPGREKTGAGALPGAGKGQWQGKKKQKSKEKQK